LSPEGEWIGRFEIATERFEGRYGLQIDRNLLGITRRRAAVNAFDIEPRQMRRGFGDVDFTFGDGSIEFRQAILSAFNLRTYRDFETVQYTIAPDNANQSLVWAKKWQFRNRLSDVSKRRTWQRRPKRCRFVLLIFFLK
jgi:hypothetical protein